MKFGGVSFVLFYLFIDSKYIYYMVQNVINLDFSILITRKL